MNQGQGPWKANTCHHSDWLTCHGFRMLEAAQRPLPVTPSALIRGAKNFRHATERHHARLLDRVVVKGLSNIADHEGQYLRRVKSSPSLSAVKQLIVSPGSICRSSLARCAREAWPKCKASNFPRQVAQFLDKVWKAPARKKLMHAATPKPMTTWHDVENSSEQHHHSPPFPMLHLTSKSFFREVVASTWNYSTRDEKLVFQLKSVRLSSSCSTFAWNAQGCLSHQRAQSHRCKRRAPSLPAHCEGRVNGMVSINVGRLALVSNNFCFFTI